MILKALRTLHLIRHAYTPIHLISNDFDRPIDFGCQTHTQKFPVTTKNSLSRIDHVYCSSAVRTRQTYVLLQPYFSKDPTIVYTDLLYDKKDEYTQVVWDLLREVPNEKNNVLIIGHNPGLTDFYNSLSVPNYENIHFPPLGLATIQFHPTSSWDQVYAEQAIERNISACA